MNQDTDPSKCNSPPPPPPPPCCLQNGGPSPSAGAMVLSKMFFQWQWQSGWKTMYDNPAVAIEAVALVIPPIAGILGAVWAVTRQRTAWMRRQFSSTVTMTHLSFRRMSSSSASTETATSRRQRPTLLLRTLAEQSIDSLVPNGHGQTELLRAARRYECTPDNQHVQLIHLPCQTSAPLVSNYALNFISSLFAQGFLQRDILSSSPSSSSSQQILCCERYAIGLACSTGPAGGTKLRMIVTSLQTLQYAGTLLQQPLYEHADHQTAFWLLLRLCQAVQQPDSTPPSSHSSSSGMDPADFVRKHADAPRSVQLIISPPPPSSS